MNVKLIFIAFALIMFSCNGDENINNEVSLEIAEAAQFIRFEIEDRAIHLTEFKDDPWPFHGKIVETDSIDFDPATSTPISRAVYASVPDDQDLPNHIETFGIEFNRLFLDTDIDTNTNQVLDDEQFRSKFLAIGEQAINLSNFGFHQIYIIGYGQADDQYIEITDIQNVAGNPHLILVSGEFNGSIGYEEYIDRLSNGKFTLLIEN